jgi:hypothetical protein
LLYLGYLAIKKPKWRKYRCRKLPYDRIFRGREYGYDPKTFLKDIKSVEVGLNQLKTWYKNGGEPILLKGVTGIGKSRLVTEFIGHLGMWDRLWRKVLMPTPHEMNEKFPPFFTRCCILFLNDLHEFRHSVLDSKLSFYVENKKFKVVATIPTEKYDPDWPLLSRFTWREVSLESWTPEEGRRLANIKNIAFESRTFKGTPLSVLAPDAEIKRSYELLSSGEKAVLIALKIIKAHLACFTDYELVSAMQPSVGKFDYSDFLNVVSKRGLWCKIDDSKCLLADGMEDFIPYEVSITDAYRLQIILESE